MKCFENLAVWKAFGVWELEFESEAVRIFLFETLQMDVCKGFCKGLMGKPYNFHVCTRLAPYSIAKCNV